MLEVRNLINLKSFLALLFSVFSCYLWMPLNADEYKAICNSRECLLKVNEDLITTPFGSIKSSLTFKRHSLELQIASYSSAFRGISRKQ